MSKITNDTGLTRSGTGCFIVVPAWQRWMSKGIKSLQYLYLSVVDGDLQRRVIRSQAEFDWCARGDDVQNVSEMMWRWNVSGQWRRRIVQLIGSDCCMVCGLLDHTGRLTPHSARSLVERQIPTVSISVVHLGRVSCRLLSIVLQCNWKRGESLLTLFGRCTTQRQQWLATRRHPLLQTSTAPSKLDDRQSRFKLIQRNNITLCKQHYRSFATEQEFGA